MINKNLLDTYELFVSFHQTKMSIHVDGFQMRMNKAGQGRARQDGGGRVRKWQGSTGTDRAGQDRTGQDRAGNDSTEQDRTGSGR
jgi:hypothetical protein